MLMDKISLKCPVCGYVFQDEKKKEGNFCPLCSSEYDFDKATEFFENTKQENITPQPSDKPRWKKVLEWALFFLSFSAFIVALYYIIGYIVG